MLRALLRRLAWLRPLSLARAARTTVLAALLASFLLVHLAAAPVINEIMYRPGTTYPENPHHEFIELHNPDTTPVDLSGWAFTTGADFTFPAGTTLPANGYLIVAADPAALRATGVGGTILGPWKSRATLSNRGEKITLAKPAATAGTFTEVDVVTYADEGDWAVRTRDTLGGWSWVTGANGAGRSLERRNPRLAVNNGQNWGDSTAVGGSPNAANSLLSSNLAPVIHDVSHAPAVPRSGDVVRIAARLTDESAATALNATLHWRDASTNTPAAFRTAAMTHESNGRFAATLPAMAHKTIVEFYVSATDGTHTRTWPAPTSEGQNANAVYQVDDEVIPGSASTYRLVLTATENAAYETAAAAGPGPGSSTNRTYNTTVVVTAPGGTDDTIRYRASIRVRGESSRSHAVKAYRVSLPTDDRLDGLTDFNLNPRFPWAQFLGMRLVRAAGLAAPDVIPIEVRRNGAEYNSEDPTGSPNARANGLGYGRWARVNDINGDYADRNWPNAVDAQVYRKDRSSYWAHVDPAPDNPDTSWSGWTKQNQHALNDWSDVMNFSKVWQDTAAKHFTNVTDGTVQTGTWNKTAFTDADIATLSTVADFDQLARWFAVMTILQNTEPNVANGGDDDYAAAWISDGTHRRLQLLPHDLDNILGKGEESQGATAFGLYPMTEAREGGGGNITLPPGTMPPGGMQPPPGGGDVTVPPPGGGGGPITIINPGGGGPGGVGGAGQGYKPLMPLFGDKDTPGNPAFLAKYHTYLREYLGSIFDADTNTGGTPPFHAFIDNHVGDWLPDTLRTELKTFMTTRQKHLLDLLNQPKLAPATATSTATFTATTAAPTLRINEVLATNVTAHANGATRPDVIELFNSGTTALDLAGKSLTDDPATPRKYVFPAGTTIPAGGYLLVYADTDTSAPGLHTGFSIDAEGDTLRLHDSSSNNSALLDSVVFGFQIHDRSISRTGTSATTWALTSPTLGAANAPALALGNASALRLNEWAGNIQFRTDHDFIELYNSAAEPVALTGIRLTDDRTNYPTRYTFPALSFIAGRGHLALYGADFVFGLDGDHDWVFLSGENNALIDQADVASQRDDTSTGRTTDGAATWTTFTVPTPGISNSTALPATHRALLEDLRITELLYQPSASNNAGDYEFIELQNLGKTTLDLSGVRFTNGLDYTFPAGTRLAPNAFIVVAKNRDAFRTRYASAFSSLAPGQFTGALDNNGETLALTLPEPWNVHILRFRYEPDWQPLASGSGHSLVVCAPSVSQPREYARASTWRASSAPHGNPGAADHGGLTVALAQANTLTTGQGGSTTFAVNAPAGATIQWQRLVHETWINLSATTASYTIGSTQPSHSGTYRALVTANGSTVASDPITLVVDATAPATPAIRIVNLSTRAVVQSATDPVVPGFVLAGTGTKRLLLRAVGPTLRSFGVTNPLADPQLALKRWNPTTNAYVDVTSNDNWSAQTPATAANNVAAFTTASGAVGAFALANDSTDAALLVDLAAGQFTAVTTGANNGTGIVLVELYDNDTAATSTATLANLATRAFVGTGDNLLAGGFVIAGTGTKTLLVRAAGPALSAFNVPNALADPQLTLFRGTEQLHQNNDWSTAENSAALATAATRVGAFTFANGSKDAALLVTLPAGAYTVQVTGTTDTTGVALLEFYEVP